MLIGCYYTLSGVDLTLEKLFVQKLSLGARPHGFQNRFFQFYQ